MRARDPLCTVGGSADYAVLWKTVWSFLKNLKMELSFDPVIPHFPLQDAKIRALWYPAIAFGVKPWLPNIHWSILLGKFDKLRTSDMYRFYMSSIFQYSGFQ